MLKKVKFKEVSDIISVSSGNPVSNRNVILQGVGRSLGFNSYNQAKALNDRQKLLTSTGAIWADNAPFLSSDLKTIEQKIIVQSCFLKVKLDSVLSIKGENATYLKLLISNLEYKDKDHVLKIPLKSNAVPSLPLPEDIQVSENSVKFFVGNDEIIIEASDSNQHLVSINIYLNKSLYRNYKAESVGGRFFDPNWQIPRIIYESMACLSPERYKEIEDRAKLAGYDMGSIVDTAYYFWYSNLNAHFNEEKYHAKKPKKLFSREIKLFAYDLFASAIAEDANCLIDSMNISVTELEELLQLASHEKDWHIATRE